MITGSLGLAVYYGVGNDYRTSLGPLADGLFVALHPDAPFSELSAILGGSWISRNGSSSDLTIGNLSSWFGHISALTWLNVLSWSGSSMRLEDSSILVSESVRGRDHGCDSEERLLGCIETRQMFECKECEYRLPMQIPIP